MEFSLKDPKVIKFIKTELQETFYDVLLDTDLDTTLSFEKKSLIHILYKIHTGEIEEDLDFSMIDYSKFISILRCPIEKYELPRKEITQDNFEKYKKHPLSCDKNGNTALIFACVR